MATNNAINLYKPFPLFRSYNSVNIANCTGDGTAYSIGFDTDTFDYGSNVAAGILTIPVTARYYLNVSLSLSNLAAAHTAGVLTIGTVANYLYTVINPGVTRSNTNGNTIAISGILSLTVGDTVQPILTISNGNKIVGITAVYSYFCGYIIHD